MSGEIVSLSRKQALEGFVSDQTNVDPIIPLLRDTLFGDGQIIIRQGDQKGPLFFIAQGLVSVHRQISPGQIVHLADIRPGGLVGEMSLVFNQPRSATVKAEEFVLAYLLDERDWEYIQNNHQDLAHEIEQMAKGRQKILQSLDITF